MWYAIAAAILTLGGGAAGYLYGGKVEAAAWKKILTLKGQAVAEYEALRKKL